MKKFPSRVLAGTVVALALGVGAPVVAAASPGGSSTNAAPHGYRQELRAYRQAIAQIQANFQAAVSAARGAYRSALASATTAAQRSAALQTMDAAIIQAAAVRSAALTALGNPPSHTA
jgi:hypothetical protein